MKKAQITVSYIVYPPNYNPGDGFKLARFLKKARNIALDMGVGAEVCQLFDVYKRDGSSHHWMELYSTVVRKP